MPLEIKELVIRVNVEENAAANNGELQDVAELKKNIIKECMDKLLQQLENHLQR
jgi:hypothetical protein